ncbi:hypothetical protein H4219_001373 [Mycoemilia scoparia]|uniref:Sodium/calcium exchanger membrane region domain-containing protein n=1 Tax=Mycoemilia scoparia TaxID=417184 RepID=A0A9W8A0F8_9FUNG|nr:hypothetical protein H4219_001373 [Mycoemilia scoparia]
MNNSTRQGKGTGDRSGGATQTQQHSIETTPLLSKKASKASRISIDGNDGSFSPRRARASTSGEATGRNITFYGRHELNQIAREEHYSHHSPTWVTSFLDKVGLGCLAREDDHSRPVGFESPITLLRRTVFSSCLNILLLLVPLGIYSHHAEWNKVYVFVINFFAIIPLAQQLGYATEQLALHLGETIGGLMNATFGNAVELLVGVLALLKDKKTVVQTSLIGSMLSNLLLVGGGCFFFGGLNRVEQMFNSSAVQTYSGLLALSMLFALLPTIFHTINADAKVLEESIKELSHISAVLMLLVYLAFLLFQLKTNADLFKSVPLADKRELDRKYASSSCSVASSNGIKAAQKKAASQDANSYAAVAAAGASASSSGNGTQNPSGPGAAVVQSPETTLFVDDEADFEEEEEEESPELTIMGSSILLAIVTIITAVCAEYLVDSIDELTTQWNLSESFVGLILLPIVGNAAEHVTAITVAIKDKMDLALGVAVGSSLQIFLFVLPVLCIAGWAFDKQMDLYFGLYDIVVLLLTVMLVNYVIMDGRSNWLEGFMMLIAYIIIGYSYFLFPNSQNGEPGSAKNPFSNLAASVLSR